MIYIKNMNHLKIYETIIKKAKSENRIKYRDIYYEKHHIMPRCLFGNDDNENKVLLTAKEHFICHKLLTYIYPSHSGLTYAFHRMCYGNMHNRDYKISSKDYVYCRELLAKNCSGENHPFFGKKHNEESLKKMGAANKGKKQSEERIENRVKKCNLKRDKIRKKQSESLKGHIVTNETKQLISKKLTGKKKSQEHIMHLIESHIGIKQTKETRQKISKNSAMRNPEIAKKCGLAHRGLKRSLETRQKMSLAAKKRGNKGTQ
jgi:hypothetical protein